MTAMPEGWNSVPLKDLVKATRPRVNPKAANGLPFIGMDHVESNTMRLLGSVPATTMKSAAVRFEPGDVLYGRLRPYLNKIYRPDFAGLASAEFIVLTPGEQLDARYLQYVLNSSTFVRFASGLSTGDRPRVSLGQIGDYDIPLPSRSVQADVIAFIESCLSRIQVATGALSRARMGIAAYSRRAAQLSADGRELGTPSTGNGSAEEFIAQYESIGWKVSSLRDLAPAGVEPVLTGPFGTSLSRQDFRPTGVPVLTVGSLRGSSIEPERGYYVTDAKATSLERYRVTAGDILFSRMATVGRAGLVTDEIAGALINYHLMRVRLNLAAVDPRFFVQYVRGSGLVRAYLREVNHGATRDGINTRQLQSMPVAVPPMADQLSLIERADARDSVLVQLEAEVRRAAGRTSTLRDAIYDRAFSGAIAMGGAS